MRLKSLSWSAIGLATRLASRIGFARAAEADEKRIGYGWPSTPASRQSREAGHELEDFSARDVSLVLGTIAGSYAILIGGIFFMVHHLVHHEHMAYARFTPQQTRTIATPPPHLDINPVEAYHTYRKQQLERLYHYDRLGGGYARIPIPRAMALELGHGLDQPAADQPGGSGKNSGGNG